MKYLEKLKTVKCEGFCNRCKIGNEAMKINDRENDPNTFSATKKIGIHKEYVNDCYVLGKHLNITNEQMRLPKNGEYIKVTDSNENNYYYFAPFLRVRESDGYFIVNFSNNRFESFTKFEFLNENELFILEELQNNDSDNLKKYKGKLWLKKRKAKNAYLTKNKIDFIKVSL